MRCWRRKEESNEKPAQTERWAKQDWCWKSVKPNKRGGEEEIGTQETLTKQIMEMTAKSEMSFHFWECQRTNHPVSPAKLSRFSALATVHASGQPLQCGSTGHSKIVQEQQQKTNNAGRLKAQQIFLSFAFFSDHLRKLCHKTLVYALPLSCISSWHCWPPPIKGVSFGLHSSMNKQCCKHKDWNNKKHHMLVPACHAWMRVNFKFILQWLFHWP